MPRESGAEELLSLAARGLQKAGYDDLIPKTHKPVQFRFSEEFRARSVHEIFVETQWKAPPYNGGELFRDKIVLIGASGNEAEDRLQTPFGPRLGPSVHLTAMNAALNRDFLYATTPAANYALIFGAGALAWVCSIFVQRPLGRFFLIGAVLLGYYAVVQWLFNTMGWYPLLLSPLLTFGGSGTTSLVWEYVVERREKHRLRRTLNRYVSKDVVRELVDNPDTFLNSLRGRRKQITVLFSDVRGFTSLTEAAKDPEAFVTQLNEYFDAMVRIVFGNKGTLDKFIGDAVMAHWGSISTEGNEVDACRPSLPECRCASHSPP
jgi:adenylate cyclase